MKVLVLNAGSSTVKLSLFELDRPGEAGEPPRGQCWERELPIDDSIRDALATLWSGGHPVISTPSAIDLVGHRVVFGGVELTRPARLTPEVSAAIVRVAETAPEHNAAALRGIAAVTEVVGDDTPQVAVFDTAFHTTLAPAAYTYAGPASWLTQGIRRFGFHGISHRYASHRAARLLGRRSEGLRVVTCHLGSGCSLAAVADGRSMDTTMGFTPLDGIPMSRRPGALDPGILIHLLRHGGHTVDSLDRMLTRESGLAGLSGTSGDMRDVLERAGSGDERARLAFDVFVHRVGQGIAAMAASMGGLDALVFTGGVGEHSAIVRRGTCLRLGFLGVTIDDVRNARHADVDGLVSPPDARTPVLVVHARENWLVANDALRLCAAPDAGGPAP